MSDRLYALLGVVACLGGCVSPAIPRVGLSGMTLPRFEMFRYGVADTSVATVPFSLAPRQLADIKRQFIAVYPDRPPLRFGPITARQKADSTLVVCGLVDVPRRVGGYAGMKLFDGTAVVDATGGNIAFQPKRIAGRNAPDLDIYSDCRDAGVL